MRQALEAVLANEIDPAYAKRARYIFEAVEKVKPKTVLDAGCGRGFYVKALTYFPFLTKIYGIDIEDSYVKRAQAISTDKRVTLQQGSIYELPFAEQTFDLIVCSEILEHLTEPEKALQELWRVLKPDGILVVSVPNKQFPFLWDPLNWILMRFFHTHVHKDIWWLAGLWAGHERLYTIEEIQKQIKENGFTIETIRSVVYHCWPGSHFWLYGVGKNIVERLGSKDFDRFNFSQKPFSRLLASVFGYPARFDTGHEKTSVNIFLTARKLGNDKVTVRK